MGTKFPLEGNEIRLFMQWGKDLPAQHLDMDLSCYITFDEECRMEMRSAFLVDLPLRVANTVVIFVVFLIK